MTSTRLSPLKEHFELHRARLSRSELVVAEYLIGMPVDELIFRSAEEIAAEAGTSDATVIRTAKRLGFSGLPELKRICGRSLASSEPASKRLEHRFRATGTDITKIARQMFAEAHEALKTTEGLVEPEAFDQATSLIDKADTVWCLGLGTAEAVAKHCAVGLSRVGVRTRCSGASGFSLANELVDLRSQDAIVLFHALRETAELKLIADQLNSIGAPVVLISGVRLHALYKEKVSVVLKCVGVPTKLASWNLSAIVISDLLAYGVAVRNQARAMGTKDRLTALREKVSSFD
ncbi:MurR/RpiR family transcriptional regulator [Rhizobium cauense]|uniref:MurR/RpiR family transcriptional regulator n=1 Tax=Rhizobium cauense TaxID=1166683 RepID=UPI001C6EA0AF|nr:MurR/RpiR family transcriptional regulator [Rhizobium cauense]MBW9116977.1 MurR/RpiR family transcriptional regulator [Rhizobium cauense]